MSQEHAAAKVAVPYLLNEPTTSAEKELQKLGFTWKLTGHPTQYSYVQNQTPEPGHFVARGAQIELYCVNTRPTP